MTADRHRQTAGGPSSNPGSKPGGGPGGLGGTAGGDKVAVTVRIDRDTFDLLQNVALGHEFSKVATVSRGGQIQSRDRTQSVAAVIEHLIERHRDSLVAEDRLTLGRGGKTAGPGGQKAP